MRYDNTINSWIISLSEWRNIGLTKGQYKDYKHRKGLKTTGTAHRGKEVEIILNTVPADKRQIIIDALKLSDRNMEESLAEAKRGGAVVSDVVVRNTAKSIEIGGEYMLTELKAYIEEHYRPYISYYMDYTFGKSICIAYGELCAVADWLYERVQIIRSATNTKREYNRYMRSFRANFLEILPDVGLSRGIPKNDHRFAEFLENLILKYNNGAKAYEVIKPKRAGNKTSSRFTDAQKKVAERIYCNGNLNDQQVYDRLVEHGEQSAWWRKNGQYKPISYGTLNYWLTDERDRLELKRSDRIGFYQTAVPTINREYPHEKNYCWGIDGTAHNEHIKAFGSVRQHIYVIKVFDYTTLRLLRVEVIRKQGESESGDLMIAAIKGAIRMTGYVPYLIQSDQGPGFLELKRWAESEHIKMLPSQTGISRNKIVEGLLGQVQRQILNTLKGWNGQNRTAQHRNSRPSASFWKKGVSNARDFKTASDWLQAELPTIWNEHIIQSMGGKLLNKTPDELWLERPSKTQKLPYENMLLTAGILHKVQKSINGVDVIFLNQGWRYIPDLENIEEAAETWLSIRTGSSVQVYVGEYGEPIAVWQGDLYHGLWKLKERVHMFAKYEQDEAKIEKLTRMDQWQKAVEDRARQITAENEHEYSQRNDIEEIEKLINEPLPNRRRRTTKSIEKPELYGKKRLNDLEEAEKYEDFENKVAEKAKKTHLKELVDPDTGEIHVIEIRD